MGCQKLSIIQNTTFRPFTVCHVYNQRAYDKLYNSCSIRLFIFPIFDLMMKRIKLSSHRMQHRSQELNNLHNSSLKLKVTKDEDLSNTLNFNMIPSIVPIGIEVGNPVFRKVLN